MKNYIIRNVNTNDAEQLLKIYSHYVTNTAIKFEYEVPSLAEFKSRIERIQKRFPYICLIVDGDIKGYAYASAFHEREAYKHCAELSIYIEKDMHGQGFGRALYEELESRLKTMEIINAYACIATTKKEDKYLTNNSEHFHAHLGFKKCGEFTKCGLKFGRWYDMIWMEKFIGEHKEL